MASRQPALREDVVGAHLSALPPSRPVPDEPVAESAQGSRLATRTAVAILLVGFYYLSYRYPLRMNSAQTSPTYSDTPAAVQAGKYLLLLAVLGVVVLLAPVAAKGLPLLRGRQPLMAGSLGLLAAFATGKGAVDGDLDLLTLGILLGCGVVLSLLATRWTLDPSTLGRVISVFAVVVVVVNVVQVVLFATIGRLPALAYPGTVSARFGSILDDPNGLAVILALLVPVAWLRWARHRVLRGLIVGGLLASLPLTQSFTGVLAVGVALAIIVFAEIKRAPLTVVVIGWTSSLVCFVVAGLLVEAPLFQEFLATKTDSIAGHADSFYALVHLNLVDLLGLGRDTSFYESTYVSLLYKTGLLFTVVWTVLGVVSVKRLLRRAEQMPGRSGAAYWGLASYQVAFLVGSVNMQFVSVFPNNLLYVMGIAVALFTPVAPPPGSVEAETL